MTDFWAAVPDLDRQVQERLAEVLETRGRDPQQQEMRRAFLAQVGALQDARVIDIGCGTGVLTRLLAQWPGVSAVLGVDPAAFLVERARRLATGLDKASFQEADGRALPFGNGSFELAVFDSTLSHVAQPERAQEEAFRVLRPGAKLAVFDGDYATATVALGDNDPLQACVDAMMASSVHDRWLMRRLHPLVRARGFEDIALRSHGYVDATGAGYVLSLVDRGADVLAANGQLRPQAAEALKAEARERAAAGRLFGHIAYVSLTARKPLH